MSTEPWHQRFHTNALLIVGAVAPFILFAIGLGHVFWHERLSLDWQAVALLVTGVILFFLPLRELTAKLLKVKIGEFELELQKDTAVLSEQVTKAETSVEANENEKSEEATESKDGPEENLDAAQHVAQQKGEEEAQHEGETRLLSWKRRSRHYQIDFDEFTTLRYESTSCNPSARRLLLSGSHRRWNKLS